MKIERKFIEPVEEVDINEIVRKAIKNVDSLNGSFGDRDRNNKYDAEFMIKDEEMNRYYILEIKVREETKYKKSKPTPDMLVV